MNSWTALAVTRSISVMEPFSSPTWASCSVLVSSITSSSGEPMATTSRSRARSSPFSGRGWASSAVAASSVGTGENLLAAPRVAFTECSKAQPSPSRPPPRRSVCRGRSTRRRTGWRSSRTLRPPPSRARWPIDVVVHEPVDRDRAQRGRARHQRRRDRRHRRERRRVQRGLRRRARAGRSSSPPSELPPGACTISCRFTGTLNDKLRGFYRSTYTDPDGETQTIATTQFESVDARRCFPCFDEPDRKAVFEIALIVDPDVDAISNSPIVGVRRGRRQAPHPVLPHHEDVDLPRGLRRREARDQRHGGRRRRAAAGGLHAGQAAPRASSHSRSARSRCASSRTTSTSPTPARRSIWSPSPTSRPGAMENLGCITFRDTALLVDTSSAARAELERVADVDRARARPHVVRRPRDHGVVGRASG